MSAAKNDDRSDAYILPAVAFENTRPRPSAMDKSPALSEKELLNKALQSNEATLARRRNQTLPSPVNTSSSVWKPRDSTEHYSHSLGSPVFREDHSLQPFVTSEMSSSHYEGSANTNYTVDNMDSVLQVNQATGKIYKSWANATTPEVNSQYPRRQQSLAQRLRRSQTIDRDTDWPQASSTFLSEPSPYVDPREGPQDLQSTPLSSSQYSPLPLYFRGQGYPTAKRGGKTMIGCNGWLESTEKPSEYAKKPHSKRFAFIDSIKRMAKDVTAELNSSHRRLNLAMSGFTSTQVAISLNAREQSLLYCELEFHLTSALNDYLVSEFDKGHLIANNLKKISDLWLQLGRPRVISFRYDLETQLELVALHLNEFSFYGRRQSNPSEISGLLHAMKMNARAIRVRTFCQPDSVIAKQLIDSQSLFNLLNVSHAPQLALAEIAHFFKTIVGRESGGGEKQVRDETKTSIDG
ncbi:hypothetical protein E4U17_001524 [Claviceps sp. LM77 group G4]|nr:hypothetical protein E4U17_001524 [Claviceps sp. LM77 group G4]KAG6071785.1 hypothetical protein E4U33_003496 [Claviceps sp. LM78 group G4]KAG6075257.1 hypothetical protein E4U16_003502 [Claviceps sp. LM84 group G4]